MLSKNTEYRLDHAVTDDKIGDEISARLISATPADAAEAQAVLDLLDERRNKAIEERLIVALAGDRQGAAGRELAKKINGMVAVLKAQADGDEVAATAAQFQGQVAGMTTDVTIDADVPGAAGNITLVADSVTDIDGLIAAHNAGADPDEQVTLSAGDGSQVPTADITLSGGADASDANIAETQAAMGAEPMSESARYALEHALGSKAAADEFKAAYDAMVAAVQAIS